MKPTTFLIVLAATAVCVAAATVAVVREQRATVAAPGGPLFADLLDHANDVATITIDSGTGTLTIARASDGAWGLVENDGYPVPTDKVRRLVAGLAEVRLLEPKTDRPERYARLEVEDPAPGAMSKRVTLGDAAGATLAALIVGRENYSFDLNGLRGVYVREPGGRAWLAEAALDVPTTTVTRVDRNVVDLDAEAVQAIRFEPAGSDVVTVSRPDAASEFSLEPIPEGRSADPEAVARLARAFVAVTLDDVRADRAGAARGAGVATATTFDGLTLKAELVVVDGATWLRLGATAPEDAPAGGDAKAINDRVGGWLYKLPQFKIDALTPRIDDYLVKDDGAS